MRRGIGLFLLVLMVAMVLLPYPVKSESEIVSAVDAVPVDIPVTTMFTEQIDDDITYAALLRSGSHYVVIISDNDTTTIKSYDDFKYLTKTRTFNFTVKQLVHRMEYIVILTENHLTVIDAITLDRLIEYYGNFSEIGIHESSIYAIDVENHQYLHFNGFGWDNISLPLATALHFVSDGGYELYYDDYNFYLYSDLGRQLNGTVPGKIMLAVTPFIIYYTNEATGEDGVLVINRYHWEDRETKPAVLPDGLKRAYPDFDTWLRPIIYDEHHIYYVNKSGYPISILTETGTITNVFYSGNDIYYSVLYNEANETLLVLKRFEAPIIIHLKASEEAPLIINNHTFTNNTIVASARNTTITILPGVITRTVRIYYSAPIQYDIADKILSDLGLQESITLPYTPYTELELEPGSPEIRDATQAYKPVPINFETAATLTIKMMLPDGNSREATVNIPHAMIGYHIVLPEGYTYMYKINNGEYKQLNLETGIEHTKTNTQTTQDNSPPPEAQTTQGENTETDSGNKIITGTIITILIVAVIAFFLTKARAP